MSQFTQRLTRRAWCGALAAIGLGTSRAEAASAGPTLEALTRQAVGVYVVRPFQASAAWETVFGGSRIVSTFGADVERTLVGRELRQRVNIRELGGQVGELVQRVGHTATLRVGQPVLVFLTPDKRAQAGAFWVLGMEQGCYPLRTTDADYEVAVYPEQRWLLEGGESSASNLVGRSVRDIAAELRLLRS